MDTACPDSLPHWLTVKEAVTLHQELTQRSCPIHTSAVYRWIYAGRVNGEKRAGGMYVDRASLIDFCKPVPGRRIQKPLPSESGQALAARARILSMANAPRIGGKG